MNLRRAFPISVSILAISLAACGKGKHEGEAKKDAGPLPFPVEVAPVATSDIVYRIQAPGSLEAWDQTPVVARVSGILETLSIREGDLVTPETVLATIDPERFRLQRARAEAALARADAALHETEEALKKRESLRAKDPTWVTEEEITNRRAATDIARAARAEAKAAVDLAVKEERDATVRSPAEGIVDAKFADRGQFVAPGAPIARVTRTDRLRLLFRVPEMESVALDRRPVIRFTVAANPDRVFEGRIYHVRKEADARTRQVDVLAEVGNKEGKLRPGFFASVTVDIETHAKAVVIPDSALVPSEKGFLAYVADAGVARERKLTLGLRLSDGQIEVLKGLSAGESLVVRGANALDDGAKIRIRKGENGHDAGAQGGKPTK